jgi:hypothetical protein
MRKNSCKEKKREAIVTATISVNSFNLVGAGAHGKADDLGEGNGILGALERLVHAVNVLVRHSQHTLVLLALLVELQHLGGKDHLL